MGNPVLLDLRRGEANPMLQIVGVSVLELIGAGSDNVDVAAAHALGQFIESEPDCGWTPSVH